MQVLIGIASIKQREPALRRTLTKLNQQSADIVVYLNDYVSIPQWASEFPQIEFVLGSKALGDIGDKGKFYALQSSKQSSYFFSADDDIDYPPNYVAYTKDWIDYTQGSCIVSHHGRLFLDSLAQTISLADYYRLSKVSHFAHPITNEHFVHFGGTGVMAFDTRKVKLTLSDIGEQRNIADIWVGVYAQKNQIPILVLPHNAQWLQQSPLVDTNQSIFAYSRTQNKTLIEPLNEYLQHRKLHLNTISIN